MFYKFCTSTVINTAIWNLPSMLMYILSVNVIHSLFTHKIVHLIFVHTVCEEGKCVRLKCVSGEIN